MSPLMEDDRPTHPNNGHKTLWTETRVETVRTMWADGKSCNEIAAELGNGISRNAVIGKIHRLGISGRNYEATRPKRDRTAAVTHLKKADGTRFGFEIASRRRQAPVPTRPAHVALQRPKPATAHGKAPKPLNLGLMALTSTTCKWPLNDGGPFLFCGIEKSAEHGPYCEFHRNLAVDAVRMARTRRGRSAVQGLSVNGTSVSVP